MTTRQRRAIAGFTLVELLTVIAFVGILALFGFPALHSLIIRSKLDGAARQIAGLMYQARSEALKKNAPGVVEADLVEGSLTAFVDTDNDQQLDAGETKIGGLKLPRHVIFAAPGAEPVIDGFTGGDAVFEPGGSTRDIGAFRISDLRNNYLEVRVSPKTTSRLRIRKYNPDLPDAPDGSKWFAPGEGGAPWKWY